MVGRARSPNRDKAFEIYKEHKGKIALREIAKKLDVPEKSISGWKVKDKWDDKLNGVLHKKIRSTPKNKKVNNTPKAEKYEEQSRAAIEPIELTEKQRLFAEIYVKNFNATQAAIKAGYAVDSAFAEGSRLLTNVKVKRYVSYLKQLKKEAIMADIDDIVELKMRIAFSSINDFMEFGRERVPVISSKGPVMYTNPVTGKKEVLTQVVNTARLKESWEVDGNLIKELKVTDQGTSIKLEDRDKAQDWLANYFEMNPMDKHKIEYDNERLKLEKERVRIEALKTKQDPEEEVEDDGFIEALNGTAQEDWSDEEV